MKEEENNEKEKTYINEDFKGRASPISREQAKIIFSQLEKNVCKIYEINGNTATGFLCKIPYPDQFKLLPVLITNNHVLKDEDLKINKTIKITFDDDKKKIILFIDKFRKTFTDKNLDISIVEIRPNKDDINDFLDIDENVFNNNYESIYKNENIYILQYPKNKKCSFSIDLLERIYKEKMEYFCSTDYGSSGSPILCISNFKVIGVHKGRTHFKFNEGSFIKFAIENFQKAYSYDIKKRNLLEEGFNQLYFEEKIFSQTTKNKNFCLESFKFEINNNKRDIINNKKINYLNNSVNYINKKDKIDNFHHMKCMKSQNHDIPKLTFENLNNYDKKIHNKLSNLIKDPIISKVYKIPDVLLPKNNSNVIKIQSMWRMFLSKKNYFLKKPILKLESENFLKIQYEICDKSGPALSDDDFSLYGWKKFYPKTDSFFNVDKGFVIPYGIIIKNPNDHNRVSVYEGDINIKNEKHGFGRLTTTKSVYLGDWRNGQFTGWGRETRRNGIVLEGKFINGYVEGKGILKKNKGNTYIGDFSNSKKHGRGILNTERLVYEGEFKSDKLSGNGKIYFKKEGQFYEGQFDNNKINGYGTFKWKNGDSYLGFMKDGIMHGSGTYIYKNGKIVKGFYLNGIRQELD